MQRSYKRLLTFLSVLVIVGVAGLMGHLLARNEPRIVEPKPEKTAAAVGANDARISSDARVTWIYKYTMCRHQTEEIRPVGESMVGQNFSQLKQQYPKLRIVSFDAHEIILEKSFVCYCPSHYILKKAGDDLAVFRTRAGTDEQANIRILNTPFADIELDEREPLVVGKVFSTMTEIDDYILSIVREAE